MNHASKGLIVAGIAAAVIRLCVFAITARAPLTVDSGNVVSPSIAFGTDIHFYQKQKEQMFSASVPDLLAGCLSGPPSRWKMVSGPVFPTLLYLFRYEAGNTWPLASLYLMGSICLVWLWLGWLHGRGVPWFWLMVFAFIPNPIYYMICVSTELPFSLLFAVFFLAYFKSPWTKRDVYVWAAALLLLLLTRPNGISILLFVIADLVLLRWHKGSAAKTVVSLVLGATALAFGLFFGPYFLLVQDSALAKTFFGVPAYQYWEGMWPALPEGLNQMVSVVLLLLAKTLYFLGLRPSYSDVSIFYVFLRGFTGLILLPGLIYLCWKGAGRHRMLLAFFLLPILMVGAQERYNLPIQPLLFFYGVRAFGHIGGWVG